MITVEALFEFLLCNGYEQAGSKHTSDITEDKNVYILIIVDLKYHLTHTYNRIKLQLIHMAIPLNSQSLRTIIIGNGTFPIPHQEFIGF